MPTLVILPGTETIMFIGHLPAGYLATRALIRTSRFSRTSNRRWLWVVGLVGSVLPDIDLFWFYLVDGRMHHHHSYWTHLPAFWFLLLSICWLLLRGRVWREMLVVFGVGVFLHLVLDTMAGRIAWLCPFDCNGVGLIEVPSLYQPWWLNFFLHWTFAVEILVMVLAVVAFRHDRAVMRYG